MNRYRWTLRVAFSGIALLAVIAVFVAVVRGFDVMIAGVYPEVWVLTAMMTAPFTIGIVSVATIATASVETFRRRRAASA